MPRMGKPFHYPLCSEWHETEVDGNWDLNPSYSAARRRDDMMAMGTFFVGIFVGLGWTVWTMWFQ